MGWVLNFCENFSKILIGLSPICRLCICVGPLWHFTVVLMHFSICSCILHKSYALLLDRCLSKCPSDILVLNWTQVSSNDRFLSCLIMLTMFWSLSLCFTHFAHVAHTGHTLGLSRHNLCIVIMLTWFNAFSMLVVFIYSVFELFLLCFLNCCTFALN